MDRRAQAPWVHKESDMTERLTLTPEVMYGCESWTIKKAEHQRIDAFELCYWRTLLKVPWTTRRSNQSILGEMSPECSLEGLMVEAETSILWPPNERS